jgi:hypothetical protein
VTPGMTVRLYTQAFHDECMQPFDEPELLHTALEKAVLEVRLLLCEFGTVSQLLCETMSPPKATRISQAVSELFDSGAFMSDDEMSVVSDFGRLAAGMPVDLACAKLIHLGIVFGCLPDAIVMAAAQSLQDVFVMPSSVYLKDLKTYAEKLTENFAARLKFDGGLYSEPLCYRAMYMQWIQSTKKKRSAEEMGICLSRAGQMDAMVMDMVSKIMPIFESWQDHDIRRKLDSLYHCASRRGGHCDVDSSDIFCDDCNVLRVVLAGACAPRFLIGTSKSLQEIEDSGLEKCRALLFAQIPTELSTEKVFCSAIEKLGLKVDRFVCAREGRAVVQLAKHRSDPMKSGTGLEETEQAIVSDMDFACKLIYQFLDTNPNYCLELPNPNFRPGWDGAEIAVIKNISGHRLLAWQTRSGSKVKPYHRSPLGRVADLGIKIEAVRYAAALSIRGISGSEGKFGDFAGGVSLLPPGLFGRILQTVFTSRHARVMAETDVHRQFIFSCQIDDQWIAFEPFVLTVSEDLALVNRMRKLVSLSIANLTDRSELGEDTAITFQDEAKNTITDLIQLLLRCDRAASPVPGIERCLVLLSTEESLDYLPQLSLNYEIQGDASSDDFQFNCTSEADRAVVVSFLKYYQRTGKHLPVSAAQLNSWLNTSCQHGRGTQHTELCNTVWRDLQDKKVRFARKRLTELLIGFGCASRGHKRSHLVWDMVQVDKMLSAGSEVSEVIEELELDKACLAGPPSSRDVDGQATAVAAASSEAESVSSSRAGSDPPDHSFEDFRAGKVELAVVVSCLQYYQRAGAGFPIKTSNLNKWLNARSQHGRGTQHTELCNTVWRDLQDKKVRFARKRLTELLIGFGCASRGHKRSHLVWDMVQVDKMLSAGSGNGSVLSEVIERLELDKACLAGPPSSTMSSSRAESDSPDQPLETGIERCRLEERQRQAHSACIKVPGESPILSGHSRFPDANLSGPMEPSYPTHHLQGFGSLLTGDEDLSQLDSAVMARFYGAYDLGNNGYSSAPSNPVVDGPGQQIVESGCQIKEDAAAARSPLPTTSCGNYSVESSSPHCAQDPSRQGPEPAAETIGAGLQEGMVVIARYHGDGLWYQGRLESMSAVGRSMVVFIGYEADGAQETGAEDVLTVEPCLAEALAARHLGGQLTAQICGALGLWAAAQLRYVADADVEGLGLRPVQRNALLALVRERRGCSS